MQTPRSSPWRKRMWTAVTALELSCGAARLWPADEPLEPVKVRDLAPMGHTGGDDPSVWSLTVESEDSVETTTRVRWWLGEQALVACIEGKGGRDARALGAPCERAAAAFRVVDRFDIRREYNSMAGEEVNVIQENRTDRPWHEREYVRVDWTRDVLSPATDAQRAASEALDSMGTVYTFDSRENDEFGRRELYARQHGRSAIGASEPARALRHALRWIGVLPAAGRVEQIEMTRWD